MTPQSKYDCLSVLGGWQTRRIRDGKLFGPVFNSINDLWNWQKSHLHPKYVSTTWELRTYDVWGNAKDGYDVNDSFRAGTETIRCKVNTRNAGTPQEFQSAHPSDSQIRRAFGLGRIRLETYGDDMTIYVNRARDGYPIGEMHCASHKSLSPIRK